MAEKWVLCLKHGTKYSSDYVNRLYNMVKRNLTVPFNFACITEDPAGLNSNIKHIPIPPYELSGWWFKTWVFSKELPISGEVLFMDLDIVIIDNIDAIWEYNPSKFCIIRDFTRSSIPNWHKFNSSVFRFTAGQYDYIWQALNRDLNQINLYHGDQDFLTEHLTTNFDYFPDIWMQSYKWEVRNRRELSKIGDKYTFNEIISPIIHNDTKILVFHGDPKPTEVQDPIVVNNWK